MIPYCEHYHYHYSVVPIKIPSFVSGEANVTPMVAATISMNITANAPDTANASVTVTLTCCV